MNNNLIEGILSNNHQSIAKAISVIQDRSNSGKLESILDGVYNRTGKSYRLGITGPPGAGKSSITNEIIKLLSSDKNIAVLSVDPTSPFTGGAILGDRIRMVEHYDNPNVFIRSIGSRGSRGGLTKNINLAADILDAAGFDIIIFETVGVGQVELDVMESADTTIVVLVPESGDDIQMLKAGMMEIADIFAINKSDRSGADKINISLNNFLSILPQDKNSWHPKVVKTSVYDNFGFKELIDVVYERYEFLNITGKREKKQQDRYVKQVQDLISSYINADFWTDSKKEILNKELNVKMRIRMNPLVLAKKLINESK